MVCASGATNKSISVEKCVWIDSLLKVGSHHESGFFLWLCRMLIFLSLSRPCAFCILLMYADLICPSAHLPFAVLTCYKSFGDIYFIEFVVLHTMGCVQSCFWNCVLISYTECYLLFDMLFSELNDVLIKIIWVHNHGFWSSKRKESDDNNLNAVIKLSVYTKCMNFS